MTVFSQLLLLFLEAYLPRKFVEVPILTGKNSHFIILEEGGAPRWISLQQVLL